MRAFARRAAVDGVMALPALQSAVAARLYEEHRPFL